MSDNKLNKHEVLDWISEHEIAWEDFVNYFEDIYQSSAEVPIDEILGWISDHDDLAEDFENKFGISVNADVCDDDCDWFEDELGEHVAVDIYDQINSSNIIEIKPSGLKEGILDVFKKKPYLVVDQRHDNKILSKHATKEEAQEAAENAGGVWRSVYVMTADELKSREQRLKKEAQKKVTGWGLRDLRDGRFVYKFDTEDEARNHFRKLADSQKMRFSVDPILESINSSDEKWNIGSNKLVSTDSQEYANLVDLAKLLQERSPNKYQYTVEKTYEDFGAGMQWYNIICHDKKGDSWQVLDTKEWLDLANDNKSVEETYQNVVTDRFFQDTVEKGSIFSILDKFQ